MRSEWTPWSARSGAGLATTRVVMLAMLVLTLTLVAWEAMLALTRREVMLATLATTLALARWEVALKTLASTLALAIVWTLALARWEAALSTLAPTLVMLLRAIMLLMPLLSSSPSPPSTHAWRHVAGSPRMATSTMAMAKAPVLRAVTTGRVTSCSDPWRPIPMPRDAVLQPPLVQDASRFMVATKGLR